MILNAHLFAVKIALLISSLSEVQLPANSKVRF
jgi:hypothetical protein